MGFIGKNDLEREHAVAVELLRGLVHIPSFSREEEAAADYLEAWMRREGFPVHRVGHNLYCCQDDLSIPSDKPTLLLNAHIDTVHPAGGYTRDPFSPDIEESDVSGSYCPTLFGLGANDDGGSLVALLAAYKLLTAKEQPYRLVYSATAEEEVSGKGGIETLFPKLGPVAFGIMGEPTGMQMAVGERGLMVLDCTVHGKSGHAARAEGVNAIYEALPDIDWFRNHNFEKVSEFLGPVKMSVTMISAGTQHNVVPDECKFVVDVRPNGMYTNVELLDMIEASVKCDIKARSTRLGSSHIDSGHPVVRRGLELGLECFGSPTTSNQALSPFTTLKIGPGQSSRSHCADEFITLEEIRRGISIYFDLLVGLVL